jgi:hypothetical protein
LQRQALHSREALVLQRMGTAAPVPA